ncbi:FAD:protein FMN transferase [Myceligenerans sp. I2]|uniref:FAD:protein FMN transferase n=2 Tax=Myceligenerans indicum TaxID=2593663 RepID=A0ABS1LFU2_9MICO|nr:FAD:protein FMN transferase [Myceligenerans indicum]
MGTVVSVDLPDGWAPDPVETVFTAVDERYSLYRADSELSRVADGRLALADAGSRVRATYARALDWQAATGGVFTPHRPGGGLDLNGIVKAEAIEQAGELLTASGCPAWTINAGGDILTSGDDGPLRVGIADPADPTALLCAIGLDGDRRAVATSGSAQRGDHIWRDRSLTPAAFVQASVVAADIVTADVLATAVVAGGPAVLDDLSGRWDVDVLAVDRAGGIRATPGLRRALLGPAGAAARGADDIG